MELRQFLGKMSQKLGSGLFCADVTVITVITAEVPHTQPSSVLWASYSLAGD
jgi:hypothetical protein